VKEHGGSFAALKANNCYIPQKYRAEHGTHYNYLINCRQCSYSFIRAKPYSTIMVHLITDQGPYQVMVSYELPRTYIHPLL